MKILIVMNYRKDRGPTLNADALAQEFRNEGFYTEIISAYGTIRQRLKNAAKIFKITANFDYIIAEGCSYYGTWPILVGVLAAKIRHKKLLVIYHGGVQLQT